MHKRLISFALGFVLLLTGIAFAAGIRVDMGRVRGVPGQQKEVALKISQVTNLGVKGLQCTLNYDPAKLEFISVTSAGAITQQWGNPMFKVKAPGKVSIVMIGLSPLEGKGDLFKAVFKINSNAKPGNSIIKVTDFQVNEGIVTKIFVSNGAIVVTKK